MDKETLSNYGWIVICVLVLAVMLGLATPFGSFISTAVKDTTAGLFATNQKALDIAGIPIANQSFNTTDESGKAKLEADKPTKIDEDTTTLVVGNKEIPVDMPAGTIIDMDEDGNATATVPNKEPEVPTEPVKAELVQFTLGELNSVNTSITQQKVEYNEAYQVKTYPSSIVHKSVCRFSIDENGKITALPAKLSYINEAKEIELFMNGKNMDHKPNFVAYRTNNNISSLGGVKGNSIEFFYGLYEEEDTEQKTICLAAYEKSIYGTMFHVAKRTNDTYFNANKDSQINSASLTETKFRKATKYVPVQTLGSKSYVPTETYTAEKGMTLKQWLNSSYNTDKLPTDTVLKDTEGNALSLETIILNGSNYVTKVNEETPKNQISFSINGKSYVAEEGMTWGEWVKSSYNTTYADNYTTFEKYIKEYYKSTWSFEFTYADEDPVTDSQRYKNVKGVTNVLKDGYIFASEKDNRVKMAGIYFFNSNGDVLHRERNSDYISQGGDFCLAKNGTYVSQNSGDIIQNGTTYNVIYND